MMGRVGRVAIGLAAVFLSLASLGASAQAQGCSPALPATAGMAPVAITPVTLRILQASITPAPATDGFVHLAYVAQITNVSHDPAEISGVTPTDALNGWTPTGRFSVQDMDGHDITGMVLPFKPEPVDGAAPAKPTYSRQLQGGGSGMMFFDVRYQHLADVPRLLSHRLTVATGGQTVTEQTNPFAIGCKAAVVLSPPLKGSNWWDANGCCTVVSPHRGATLPVNGNFVAPEQFAIDYAQLTAGGGCCTGPVKDLGSWPFFRAPILAAADGVVVEATDGMAEQVPGPPQGVTAQNAAGNHLIEDIGGGHYILYAHLHTGSVPSRLVAGAHLRSGEQIGELGNTGSSTSPHLHFQVMDRPSTLDAIGLPFVFDRQVFQGTVIGTASATNDAYEAGGTVVVERGTPAVRANLMPAEGQVFGYHVK